MKAIVKATGKIVEVKSKVITSSVIGKNILKYVDQKTGVSYFEEELFFPKDLADDPDYWIRLEHQYAGMAMHGILSNSEYLRSLMHTKYNDYRAHEVVPNVAVRLSHALVEKLKEERK